MLLLLLIDPLNHSNLSSSVLHCPWPLSLITFWQDLASSMSQYKETEYFYLLEKHAKIPSSKIFLNLKIISFKTPTTILIFQTNINHYSSFHLHNIILCKSAIKVSSGWMFPNFTYIHNTNRKNYFYDTLRRYQKVTYDQKVTSPRSSQPQDSEVSCRLFTTSLNLEHKNRFYIYSPPTKGVCVCTYVHTHPYICTCIYKWFSNPNWTVFAHFSTKNRSLILMQLLHSYWPPSNFSNMIYPHIGKCLCKYFSSKSLYREHILISFNWHTYFFPENSSPFPVSIHSFLFQRATFMPQGLCIPVKTPTS